jgi:hypothetical protein
MNVDWEERWNVERWRTYRFGRARDALAASELGAILLFDFNNIRYVTSTHIGEWARDKMTRYALQTRGGEPHIWDFGSAAKHHRLNCPWLRLENIHAGMIGLRARCPRRRPVRAQRRRSRISRPGCRLPGRHRGAPMVAALAPRRHRPRREVMLTPERSSTEIVLLSTLPDGGIGYQYRRAPGQVSVSKHA